MRARAARFIRASVFLGIAGALVLPGTVRAADPLEIPAVLSLTGQASFLGKTEANALKLAEAAINKSGGLKGRQIKITVYDDQTSPQVAVQLMTQALEKKPLIVFDGGPAATCRATAALMTGGPVMYCFTPAIDPAPGGFVFSSSTSSDAALAVGVKYLSARGLKKIGLLNGTDASGQDGDRILADTMKDPDNIKAGMSIVAAEHYNLTDLSVIAQLTKIRAAGAQALVVFTTGTAVATVMHGMQDLGLDFPLLLSPGLMSYTTLDSWKSFIPKELIFPGTPLFVPDQLTDAGVKKAVVALTDALKSADPAARADLLSAVAWDPITLVASVLGRTGTDITAERLRTELSNTIDFPGALGRYNFKVTPQRGLGVSGVIMERWNADKSTFTAVSKPGGGPLPL